MADDDVKRTLHGYLRRAREAMVWKLDGLSDYDVRRPLTPTGTNLLGLAKHLFGRYGVGQLERGARRGMVGRPAGTHRRGGKGSSVMTSRTTPMGPPPGAGRIRGLPFREAPACPSLARRSNHRLRENESHAPH